MARPPRIPVWLRSDQEVTYFITICVEDRRHVLANQATFDAVLAFCRGSSNWHTIAGVIMPDHFHALIEPLKDREAKPTTFTAPLKRFVRERVDAKWKWQEGVFDRLLRNSEFIEGKWHYMRENPVRAGLVRTWTEWPFRIEREL